MFHGLSAFALTPTDPDGRVRPAEFGRLLRPLVGAGVDSIGVLGSTGGYAYLEPDQRRIAVEAAVAEIAGQVPLIVGVSALRTDTACALARHARNAGADALLVAPMSYTPLTDDEVLAHYDAVARAADLPVCVYNNPSTTHFTITPDLLERLSGIPQVRAVKMPLPANGDVARELALLRSRLPRGFTVGYSADWGCAGAMLAGADAFYSVAAGIWPGAMLRLVRAARSGDAPETARLDAAFGPLWSLFRERGSFRVVYRAATLSGLSDAPPPAPDPAHAGPRRRATWRDGFRGNNRSNLSPGHTLLIGGTPPSKSTLVACDAPADAPAIARPGHRGFFHQQETSCALPISPPPFLCPR